jgi:hypothetical protein
MTLDFRAYAQSLDLKKYPRTPHLEGSRLQPGDEGYEHVPYKELAGCYLVAEEKLDGAAGELMLQSKGHYLVGGGRERQFNILKAWARAHENWLMERLEDRYVMYGECMTKTMSRVLYWHVALSRFLRGNTPVMYRHVFSAGG